MIMPVPYLADNFIVVMLSITIFITLGLLALPDLLIMIFSAKDQRVRFAGIYGRSPSQSTPSASFP
jgi:Na+/pantothenate symporter